MKRKYPAFYIVTGMALWIAGMVAAGTAHAQDAAVYMMQQATVQTALMNSAVDANNEPRRKDPPKPATLYRERVPGKPEEGFVPVTAAPAKKASGYVTTKVNTPYGETMIFDDYHRRVTCYQMLYGGRPTNSCVPMK
jgi:hypothetical protein